MYFTLGHYLLFVTVTELKDEAKSEEEEEKRQKVAKRKKQCKLWGHLLKFEFD
jgi:hypothetical protein